MTEEAYEGAVAIVGMAGRFPGAADADELWRNLLAGVSGLRPVPGASPGCVPVAGTVEGIETFDAAAFGCGPREAETMEPHHRLLLECSWEAMERAGYTPTDPEIPVGVFAGCAFPDYLTRNLGHGLAGDPEGKQHIAAGVERDSVTSLVSYKLGLRGPSLTVQTYCSTSLVAVHLACQSLLTFECDMALAGGAFLPLPQGNGYRYDEGGILSADGRVRSLDAAANGTVMGSGAAMVALKRLADALASGDLVHAVILGSAVNNDGHDRAGYAAPGLSGQAAVIEAALAVADVEPDSVGYVECHAVGTPLGDSIELAALNRVFGERQGNPCVLSSVKPSIGHLDRAAGVTGLIRAALSLRHRVLPATAGFETPNPALAQGTFTVLTVDRGWPAGQLPRRAGVSSFGLGGTNAHVVLEEAPACPARPARPGPYLLPFSAGNQAALDEYTRRLRSHLAAHPELDLADVAFTLQVSRGRFALRRAVVCADFGDALAALADPARWIDGETRRRDPKVRLVPAATFHAAALERLGVRLSDDPDAVEVSAEPSGQASMLLATVARAWLAGSRIDWGELHPGGGRRVELPTYPFQRGRHWIDEPPALPADEHLADAGHALDAGPGGWQPFEPSADEPGPRLRAVGPWLVFAADQRAEDLVSRLVYAGAEVVAVRPGRSFSCDEGGDFAVRPADAGDLTALLRSLVTTPRTIVHGFSLGSDPAWGSASVAALAGVLAEADTLPPAELVLLTAGAAAVYGTDLDHPEHAAVGSLAVWLAGQDRCLGCRHIDMDAAPDPDQVLACAVVPCAGHFAIRNGQVWVLTGHARRRPASRVVSPASGAPASVVPAGGGQRRPRPMLGTTFVEPADERERAVADVWAEVLGLAEIGADDNFFDLGGRSAAAVQIASRLADRCPRLPLTAVVEHPTVRLLTAEVAALAGP